MKSQEDIETEKEEIKLSNDRWKYRRRMAFTAFFVVISVLFMVLFQIVTLDELSIDIVQYIIGGLILVVLGYQGVSTADDLGMKFMKRRDRRKREKDFYQEFDELDGEG